MYDVRTWFIVTLNAYLNHSNKDVFEGLFYTIHCEHECSVATR